MSLLCGREEEMRAEYNWKYMKNQEQIWLELQPKIANWKAEGEPDPIGYFTDGLLRWICNEIKKAKKEERKLTLLNIYEKEK